MTPEACANLLPIQHRRSRHKMPEQFDHLGEALLAMGIDVEAGIIEEARARAHADAAVAHVGGDHLDRWLSGLSRCAPDRVVQDD